jgi:UDP-N-acetyl-D-glucosamine dehydrogenase
MSPPNHPISGITPQDWGERALRRELRVAVLGLGYVGLPLALAFAERGFEVLGFDVDQDKVAALAAGKCYIEDLDDERVVRAVAAGRLLATSDFERLGEADALLICVPTPLSEDGLPDLSFVETTVRQIAKHLRRGQLVVLESTTYPGTTEEVLRPMLEANGLSPSGDQGGETLACGRDFYLAFSPERIDPGNRHFTIHEVPKLVGGVDAASGEVAVALYREAFNSTVPLSSSRAAEAAKLTENIFRSVNIALVNELKTIYDAMDVDIWEVLDAAETKPYGFMRFNPGPGWGGHCIPIDPFYLAWKARQLGLRSRFIELAGEVNVEMPRYVLAKLEQALAERDRPLRDSSVLLLGLAYKPDVSDPRESPAFELLEELLKRDARVSYHDPHVPEAPRMRSWPDLPVLHSVPLSDDLLAAQDAVIVVTHHSAVDYEQVLRRARLIIDTRGVYRQLAPNVVRA